MIKKTSKKKAVEREVIAPVLQQALKNSLTSGSFIDIKIYAFSRRGHGGEANDPRPLYMNSQVLAKVPHFNRMFSEGFSEGAIVDIRATPPSKDSIIDYDYESDSDLEPDPNDMHPAGEGDSRLVVPLKDLSHESRNEITLSDPSGINRVSGHEDDIHVHQPKVFEEQEVAAEAPDLAGGQKVAHLGKVASILNIAFSTLHALFFYLYTGDIEFAPFGSKENRKIRFSDQMDYKRMPKCSPKSMYRLAEIFDISELRELALDNIRANLSQCDIVKEMFSDFTSRRPEVMAVEVEYFATWVRGLRDPEETLNILKAKIDLYAAGELPQCADTFSRLFRLLSKKVRIPPEPSIRPVIPTVGETCCWMNVKQALKQSLITGTFLDMQLGVYCTAEAQPSRFRTVYFSRVVVGSFFDKIEQYAGSTSNETGIETAAVYEDDSDLEEENPRACTDQEEKQLKPQSTFSIPEYPLSHGSDAVRMLKVGAASTWEALFFYAYTNSITFAPLRSDGLEARSKAIVDHQFRHPHRAGICSPKSMYKLATKLGLNALRDLAFKDIESKISEGNVVPELFSKFSSIEKEVMCMENKALQDSLANSHTFDIVEENIRTMASGEYSHRAEALKSVFQRICAGGSQVDLLCNYCGHTCRITGLGSGVFCPDSRHTNAFYFMFCSSCQTQRNSDTPICTGCKRRFKV